MSLAKTLARAESLAPLRCLVVAHLEWPDIVPPAWKGLAIVAPLRASCERADAGARRRSTRDETRRPRPGAGGRTRGVRRCRHRDRAWPALQRRRCTFRSSAHE